MVETFLLPLGPRLVEAAGIGPGMRVLDVGAGTGNASLPAARARRPVTASDLTPSCSRPARPGRRPRASTLEWVEADAENLPFEDDSFDVVMSAIGAMFAPHHQRSPTSSSASPPGRHDRAAELDPGGHDRRAVPHDGPVHAAAAPGAQPPPLWGSEEHLRGVLGGRVDFCTLERDVLEVTAFEQPDGLRRALQGPYGPTIAARPTPTATVAGRSSTPRSTAFCEERNRGTPEHARFEMEYLIAVGTRR